MNTSYWERASFLHDTDVCIIGSGIVGLFAAHYIKTTNPLLKVTVLERGVLPSGASTKNAGFVCFGTLSELIEQKKKTTEEGLLKLVEKRWSGLHKMILLLGKENIRLEMNGGYEVFMKGEEELYLESASQMDEYNLLLSDITGDKKTFRTADDKIKNFSFGNTEHLIYNPYEGQIHTGEMMKMLIEKNRQSGVQILTGVHVLNVESQTAHCIITTDKFTIKTKKTIVATNAFAEQLLPGLNVKPGRGQVLITKPIKDLKLKGTFHYDKGYYYFRNIDNRVLLGGGRNIDIKGEETFEFGSTEAIQQKLKQVLSEIILPQTGFEIDQTWSGIMAFGNELEPIIKEVEPNIFCAVRCNGMGVALGSLIGEEVAELVLKDL